MFTVAGDTVANTRGREWQDRFACGADPRGAWIVVADGIGGGERAADAAAVAVATAVAVLASGELVEPLAARAVVTAHAAVRGLLADTIEGGSTLTVACLTAGRLVVAATGDSPAFLSTGALFHQLTPAQTGPLTNYVGQPDALTPWIESWPVPPGAMVLVRTDGAGTPELSADTAPSISLIVSNALASRNADDATAVAAVWTTPPSVNVDTDDLAPAALPAPPAAPLEARTRHTGRFFP